MIKKALISGRLWPFISLFLVIGSAAAALSGQRLAMICASALTLGAMGLLIQSKKNAIQAERANSKKMAESELCFRIFADNSPMVSSIKDSKGRFRWANHSFIREFGVFKAGQEMSALRTEMELEEVKGEIDENDAAVLRGETREYLMEIPRVDAPPRSWFVLRFPLAIDSETLIGISALEVTQQREAEQRLEAYTKELERSNRELQDFASVAAHDLQEPLRKIRAFGDLLEAETEGALGPDSRDYVMRMQASAMRMQALIEDLLSFSRVNTRAVDMVPVDLGATLAEVQSDLELALAQGGMSVESEALPVIEADSTQMRQLFQNLVSNAVKFRRKDVRPLLHIACRVQGASAEFEFRDNGIGFDRRYADKIFTIFQRLHGRDEYEGNGVGLAVCRRIAERHGGAIRAESEPGKGSVFIVKLPLKQQKRKAP